MNGHSGPKAHLSGDSKPQRRGVQAAFAESCLPSVFPNCLGIRREILTPGTLLQYARCDGKPALPPSRPFQKASRPPRGNSHWWPAQVH